VWTANYNGGTVSEFSSNGVAISPPTGYFGGGMYGLFGLALDGSGNVWVCSNLNSRLIELVGGAAPVVTPIVAGVKNNALGTRPWCAPNGGKSRFPSGITTNQRIRNRKARWRIGAGQLESAYAVYLRAGMERQERTTARAKCGDLSTAPLTIKLLVASVEMAEFDTRFR
jgi:hypothetical protein